LAEHRVGRDFTSRWLWAEGHPVAGGLARADQLADAEVAVLTALRGKGFRLPDRPRITRLDTAVDLGFQNGDEGIAFLCGISALPIPRCKLEVIGNPQSAPETVYLITRGGRRLARMYDRGAHTGARARGELIRLEDQLRVKSGSRLLVSDLSSEYLRERFERRFRPFLQASEGVVVAALPPLIDEVRERIRGGDLRFPKAAALVGDLMLGLTEDICPRSTLYRRRRELRQHGLVLSPSALDPVRIDLHAPLEVALDTDIWGTTGHWPSSSRTSGEQAERSGGALAIPVAEAES
jgi:hypothetical protein